MRIWTKPLWVAVAITLYNDFARFQSLTSSLFVFSDKAYMSFAENVMKQNEPSSSENFKCPGYQNPTALDNKPSWYWIRTMKTASTSVSKVLLTLTKELNLSSTAANTKMNSNCSGLESDKDYHPHLSQHVGYRPCAEKLLRGYTQNNFVIFMAFRDPVERLVSAWKYGISYGVATQYARRSGRCAKNNITLEEYIEGCPEGSDNHYLQILDPDTMNITVALEMLNNHNILVGLQSDIQSTLDLFKQIVIDPAVTNSTFNMQVPYANKGKASAGDPLDKLSPRGKQLFAERIKYDKILFERARVIFDFQNTTCRTG